MSDEGSAISPKTISRLPIYWRYLKELDDFGIERISSQELAKRIGVTPSQLRQDLNQFGQFGQHGYGYPISELLISISRLLGLNKSWRMIIVGVGNLGKAIASYPNFGKRNIKLTALFDVDPGKVGTVVAGVKIRNISEMPSFFKEQPVDIGTICTTPEAAQAVAEMMEAGGALGIWNFAPVKLKTSLPVKHLHLGDSILELLYCINRRNEE